MNFVHLQKIKMQCDVTTGAKTRLQSAVERRVGLQAVIKYFQVKEQ